MSQLGVGEELVAVGVRPGEGARGGGGAGGYNTVSYRPSTGLPRSQVKACETDFSVTVYHPKWK